jgi:hypothetical protein
MMLSLVLIEGQNVSVETLRSVSLGNAKQLVVGNAYGFGVVLHIAADDTVYLNNAILEFAKVPGVTGVTLLATRSQL